MSHKRPYRRILPVGNPLCWVKSLSYFVCEIDLFKLDFFLRLSIEARMVYLHLIFKCYQVPYLEYDPYDITDELRINRADYYNAIQELQRVRDPFYDEPLIKIIPVKNELPRLSIPLVNLRILPIVKQGINFYVKFGKFSRLSEDDKKEILRRSMDT
jgi:hypothetical protein